MITSFLASTLGSEWQLFEETPIAHTGLILSPTSLATVKQWGCQQLDWVLVSSELKKIAIVDLHRPSGLICIQLN